MTHRLCPGCRSMDGEHDFSPTCTVREEDPQRDWLEAHDATVYFGTGKKIGLDVRRADGLRVQTSAWLLDDAIDKAKALLRTGEENR